ncbi:MAG TPA: hypothetical protein VFU21_24045 [Kofleriaceae bacterium]|nr:hypothetical protein [Kofleriaceae bacterium]
MRWGIAIGSLGLAACLDAPPSSTGSDPDPDGGGPPGGLTLNGLAARDALSLDGRDELVLIGEQGGIPVAIILSPTGPGLEDVKVSQVNLPFDPIDLMVTRWGSLTGLAVALSESGALLAIDQDGARIDLVVEEAGDRPPVVQLMGDIQYDGRRLLLADGAELYVSDPMTGAEPGEAPLPVLSLGGASDAVDVAGAEGGTDGAVGVLEADGTVHVYPFTVVEQPVIGADVATGAVAPGPLLRRLWRILDSHMILVGIDPAGPRLWFASVALGENSVATGTAVDGEFELIHDMVITKLDEATAELILLVEVGGELQVVAYLDPANTPDSLPAPVVLPVDGLKPPYWMQAMDAVLDAGPVGQNEIIVYDHTGRAACVDLVGAGLESCGTLDLAPALSGASISGRPGW